VLHDQPEVLSELLCIPEVSITQLTVGVIGHHVHLPLLSLIEVRAAELALGVVASNVGIQLLSSVGGKPQGKSTPPRLRVKHTYWAACFVTWLRLTAQTYAAMAGRIVARHGEHLVIVAHWAQGFDCMHQIWTDKDGTKAVTPAGACGDDLHHFFAQKCC